MRAEADGRIPNEATRAGSSGSHRAKIFRTAIQNDDELIKREKSLGNHHVRMFIRFEPRRRNTAAVALTSTLLCLCIISRG